jgi:hypothetical protein
VVPIRRRDQALRLLYQYVQHDELNAADLAGATFTNNAAGGTADVWSLIQKPAALASTSCHCAPSPETPMGVIMLASARSRVLQIDCATCPGAVSAARKIDSKHTPWKQGTGELAEWFARLQRPPRAAAIRLLQGLNPALRLDRAGACLVLFARSQNGFEALRGAWLAPPSSGPQVQGKLTVLMDVTQYRGKRPWHNDSNNPKCADFPVHMRVTAYTDPHLKTKPIIQCMTCGQQSPLSQLTWRDQLQMLQNGSPGHDTDLVNDLNQLHGLAPALVECIDMRTTDGNQATWKERVGPHLAYTWEQVPQLGECVRTVSVSCKAKWDETPLDVGVAMGRRALECIQLPSTAAKAKRARKIHGPRFALGWPNPDDDCLTVTSARDLAVPFAALLLSCKTATEVVRLNCTVARQQTELNDNKAELNKANARIDRLEKMLLPKVEKDDDNDGDDDDAPPHGGRGIMCISTASQSQKPPDVLPNDRPTVTHSFNVQQGVLMHIGPDGETKCLPLLASVLQRWVPEGTLKTRQDRKRFLERVRAKLKRSDKTKIGMVSEWAEISKIKTMLGVSQLSSTTAVYSVAALREVTSDL